MIIFFSVIFIPVILLVIYLLVQLFIIEPFPELKLSRKKTGSLIQLLGDDDLQGTVINTLLKRGQTVVEPLIEALLSGKRAIRIGAAEALGRFDDASAVEALLHVLPEKSEKLLRRQVIEALGNLEDARAIEPLLQVFVDPESELQLEAGQALEQIVLKTRDVELLLKTLVIPKAPFLEEAIDSAGQTGDSRFIAPLLSILEEDDRRHIREYTVEALGKIGLPDIEPLWNPLKDSYWQVREKTAILLGQMRTDEAIDALIQAFETEQRVPLQETIAGILGDIGDIRVVPSFMNALDNPQIRRKVVKTLEYMGLPVVESLRKSLGKQACHHNALVSTILGHIYASVTRVVFGQYDSTTLSRRTTWLNPEVFELTMPLSGLKWIEIHTATCNVRKVERFVTYAVNYIGQEYLKKSVGVLLYDDPKALQSNLRNTLHTICHQVHVCKAGS